MSQRNDRMFQEPASSNRLGESVYFGEGLKVVRGPNWTWKNDDDGEGHVGTVVGAGKFLSSSVKVVTVQWDGGLRNKYRIGANDFYDLRALDNSSLGVVHSATTCKSCGKKGIAGMRWKCRWCYDYNLCSRCYMSDKHDLIHPFQRIQVDNGPKVDLPKRNGSVKIKLRGIFPSATVVRSTDWRSGDRDGGSGKTGTVVKVHGWVDGCNTNACTVIWSATNLTNVHRIGYNGKMDLQYVQDAYGGYYYRDHLPIVGDELRPISVTTQKDLVNEKSDELTSISVATQKDTVSEKKSGVNKVEAERPEENTVKGGEKEEMEPDEGLDLLSQNLECLYQTSQFCDFSLKGKTREYKVHRAILGARSPVFASMLQHDTKEKNSGAAVISDCDPDSFEDFLFYIYSGKSERISKKNAIELYKAAEKYDVLELKDDCVTFLKENLSVDIVCDALSLAVTFQDSKLIEYCTNYFVSNAEDIILSVQWQNFMIENPAIANELYLKALKKKP